MMTPLCSAKMLLTLLILTSGVNFARSDSLSGRYITDDEVGFESRTQIESVLNFAKETMTVVKDVVDSKNVETVTGLLKDLSKFASAVPFIGPMFACVNMLMVFVPQHDPVMKELKEGFTEVNRKLDSLSHQISNLATDVEWFNYASVYSQDEVRILNAWKKYEQFFKDHNSNDIKHLAKIFVNYYEYTQVEASVDNLYHYLTVRDTSLSGNLNNLLLKKYKCDLKTMLNYNFYFTSLLMRGLSLNNFYWKLIGYDTTEAEAEQIKMFKNVFAAQSAVVDFCLNKHMDYVEEDVVEQAKTVSNDNLQGIADKVKQFLDEKYDWYKWVVVVYKKSKESGDYIRLNRITKIPINDDLIVAVSYTQKAAIPQDEMRKLNIAINSCLMSGDGCRVCFLRNETVSYRSYGFDLNILDYVKATHSTYNKDDFAENPSPNKTRSCSNYGWALHYSKAVSPCEGPHVKCQNKARCKRLLDSNEALCECRDGFFGETCETKIDTNLMPDISKLRLAIVKTTSVRLASIESKLNEIYKRVLKRDFFSS